MRRRRAFAHVCLLSVLFATSPVLADASKSTLVLDGLSFLSFGDEQVYAIPAGTKLVFRFGDPSGPSVAFELHPDDFRFPPLALDGAGESLHFGLAAPAKGVLSFDANGVAQMTFDARIRVQLDDPTGTGMKEIELRFTTEGASAQSPDGAKAVAVEGMRLDRSVRAIQLVTARTNRDGDYPQSGTPVYAVLSGVFDDLPAMKGGQH